MKELHVQKYLKSLLINNSHFIVEDCLEVLKLELGIDYKLYPKSDLIVLNYNQIDSPKTHPIVIECRGIILDYSFNVVARPFDRFFNAGEAPETCEGFDITRAVCHEKIDGSLIKIYYHNNMWYAGTRGTAFAESTCNGFNETFFELVCKALGFYKTSVNNYTDADLHYIFDSLCNDFLDENYTYLFELTCKENRVVTYYSGYTLWCLGIRDTKSGEYVTDDEVMYKRLHYFGAEFPKSYSFNTIEHCIEASKELKDFNEGYVCFDEVSGKRVKVKSPAYVAAHHLRGNGVPSPKNLATLVLLNEVDEYLKYFPDEEHLFEPWKKALEELKENLKWSWFMHKVTEDQKEFALAVKAYSYSALLFTAKKMYKGTIQVSIIDIFNNSNINYKLKLLESYHSYNKGCF